MTIQKFSQLALSSKLSTLEGIQSLLQDESRVFTRESFTDLLKAVFSHPVSLDTRAMADDIGYQYSSVRRWFLGSAVPHHALWPTVITWIKNALEQKRAESEKLIS